MERARAPKRFMEDWEAEKANHGSKRAIAIRKELERLSPFQYEPLSDDVEGGFIRGLHKKPEDLKLDYAVLHEGKRIALLDTTGSNYTFEGSDVMPVDEYKGVLIKDSKVPVFIVYEMGRENLPVSERCMWIHGKDIVKCQVHLDDWGGKLRHNYHTKKEDWHRGLKSLVQELAKLTTL